ncbi:MAG: translation initiation factor IF-3 [Chlamydiales bacterium]
MNFRINRQIRAPRVRVISFQGDQVGVLQIREALIMAQDLGLDLVEVAPNADPPVCKIVDYGKFRYDQTKREKESKKSQHQIKIKEIKLKPNIDEHDFQTKLKKAQVFLEKGNKVKLTCWFRGREMAYPQIGQRIVDRMIKELEQFAHLESPAKMMGRSMICVLAPQLSKSKNKEKSDAKNENK